jgi:hypothetical protein
LEALKNEMREIQRHLDASWGRPVAIRIRGAGLDDRIKQIFTNHFGFDIRNDRGEIGCTFDSADDMERAAQEIRALDTTLTIENCSLSPDSCAPAFAVVS